MARTGNGERAFNTVKDHISTKFLPNLFNTHPPFQIDGNFGYTAGIAEMLIQSHTNTVDLIPAIPDERKDGYVAGLLARGGFECAFAWKDKEVGSAVIKSNTGNTLKLNAASFEHANINITKASDNSSVEYELNGSVVTLDTAAGETYNIIVEDSTPLTIKSMRSINGNVSAEIENSSIVPITAKAYIAGYNENNELKSVSLQEVTIDSNKILNFKSSIDMKEDITNVKLMLWDNTDLNKTLSEAAVFSDLGPDINIYDMVQPVPMSNQLKDDGYLIWCGSYIQDDDGKYHVFYSRWKKEYGHTSWVSKSEIAHAVSDKLEGPYTFVDVPLPARDRSYWDGTTTHNPYIIKTDGKYYLYYIGTTAPEGTEEAPSGYSATWWRYRNGQRIGVAVSDSPYGPWERFDKPVLDISTETNEDGSTKWDSMLVSNPAVAVGPDGKVVMLYKGVQDITNGNMENKNGDVKFGVATADDPLGPFTKQPDLIFTDPNESSHIAEDPYVWYSTIDNKYKCAYTVKINLNISI